MVSGMQPNPAITAEALIPDILKSYPQLRPIFDRYGLKGCGGPEGPHETLHFFSRAHDVEEATLLRELQVALAEDRFYPAEATGDARLSIKPDIADIIYRRYFLAGIFVILTVGATWGAWLLWRIGFDASFTGVSVNEINAHGQAQVFGWMGLFMMGFAYQAFPRFWHTTLARPTLAVVAFILMLGGVMAASVGTALSGHWKESLLCAESGSLMELAAVIIFSQQIFATWRQSGKTLQPYTAYVFVALAWFVASAVFNAWHTWNTVSAGASEQLLFWVATYQSPLRDMQFHGLAMTMIFGVSLRTLPHLFVLPEIGHRRAWSALAILTTGVLAEVILFIAYRLSHNYVFAAMLIAPWLMLMIASSMLVLPWKLWRPFPEPDRSAKFIRAGFAWLFASLLMLLLLPVYQVVSHIPFSHADYGAIRHAITVGFISLMIMGYAAKVVPTLNGVDPRKLTALWGPFLLVNLGCFLRVTTQTLTDWSQSLFPLIGISGTLEVVGLAWWGFSLGAIILRGKKEMEQYDSSPIEPSSDRPSRILLDHTVADVLAWYPETERAFVRFGFTHVLNPIMRRTAARQVTIGQACKLHGVAEQDFLLALNQAIELPGACCDQCGSCAEN